MDFIVPISRKFLYDKAQNVIKGDQATLQSQNILSYDQPEMS